MGGYKRNLTVHMVVRVHGLLGSDFASEELDRAVRDDLVDVH